MRCHFFQYFPFLKNTYYVYYKILNLYKQSIQDNEYQLANPRFNKPLHFSMLTLKYMLNITKDKIETSSTDSCNSPVLEVTIFINLVFTITL